MLESIFIGNCAIVMMFGYTSWSYKCSNDPFIILKYLDKHALKNI